MPTELQTRALDVLREMAAAGMSGQRLRAIKVLRDTTNGRYTLPEYREGWRYEKPVEP